MTLILASIVLGIVPMAIYALLIWRLDRWEKEPLPLLFAAFLWGAVPSILFALVAQVVLGAPKPPEGMEASLMSELYDASFLAPLTEELVKGFGVLLIFLLFRREIDSVLDGLVYGSMVGFGFAAVENIAYFVGQPDAASLLVLFFMRAFLFGMLHALFTGLTGVGLALGKFSTSPPMKILWPLLGLGAAMGTHALHNYFATLGGHHLLYAILGVSCGVLWFAITMAICLYHENRWVRIHLSEEVESGTLFAEQALDAASFWQRGPVSMVSKGVVNAWKRRTLLQTAAELAYQKQRAARTPTAEEHSRIAILRERVFALSQTDPLVLAGRIRPGKRLPPPLPPVRRTPPPLPVE
ncbi:MAG TPA: PrsW family intramembrane metalloprotease [Bacteroidia bacterium]|nr:PrsW family intramembrane metalloprotease [Bacteroidia bacterium]